MWVKLVGFAVAQLLKQLDRETVLDLLDTMLDKLEDRMKATPGKFDPYVQAGINQIRVLLKYKDENYGTDKV